ncbi:hypothetical protein FGO68_gene17049 [Halteria grandinella]|uniref:Uncharacterized protein n=1 Tax=Halteria grandinella TaxID=5974 RepID=A0A8J8NRI6_HALGN|nr:hypothetical protein FGO68_gene17049 [Halteria grandinella]
MISMMKISTMAKFQMASAMDLAYCIVSTKLAIPTFICANGEKVFQQMGISCYSQKMLLKLTTETSMAISSSMGKAHGSAKMEGHTPASSNWGSSKDMADTQMVEELFMRENRKMIRSTEKVACLQRMVATKWAGIAVINWFVSQRPTQRKFEDKKDSSGKALL